MPSPNLSDMCARKGCGHNRGAHKMGSRFPLPGVKWTECKFCSCKSFVGSE